MGPGVAGLEAQLAQGRIVRIHQHEFTELPEPLVRLRKLFREPFQPPPEAIIHPGLDAYAQHVPARAVESAAANEDERTHAPGMRDGVRECKHRAPGVPDERGRLVVAVRSDHVVEVLHVGRHSERLASARALEGLEDSERAKEEPSDCLHSYSRSWGDARRGTPSRFAHRGSFPG